MKIKNISKLMKFKFQLIDIYCKISAKIWIKKTHLETSIWFLKRSIYAILGKEGIVDAREVYSKGGYKYYQIEISRFPLNENNDYTKF